MSDTNDILDQALEEGLLTQRGRYYYDRDGEAVAGSREEATGYLLSLADDENLDVPPGDGPGDSESHDAAGTLAGPFRYDGELTLYALPDGRTGTLYPGVIYRDLPNTDEIRDLIDARQLLPLG